MTIGAQSQPESCEEKKRLVGQYSAALNEYSRTVTVLQHKLDLMPKVEYDHVRAYLNILELMAVGVHNNTFDQRICYVYWRDFIKGAVADCRPLLDYLRALPSGGFSYGDLVRLEKRWTSAKRFWQRWRG